MHSFVKEKLLQIKDIIFSDFVLLDQYNNILFQTDESSNYSDWNKVDLSEYHMFIKEKVSPESIRFIQVILSALENQITESRSSVWHKLLFDEPVDINSISMEYRNETNINVWIIIANDITKHLEIIAMLFEMSIPIVINEDKLAIIHFQIDDNTPESIVDHLESELMIKCKLIIGNMVSSISEIGGSYANANNLSRYIFKTDSSKSVFKFEEMLIENLVGQMDNENIKNTYQEYCKLYDIDKLNVELIDTVRAFFKNNLNITDTATTLFLHRNTLIYRINRIQGFTNLDIRKFEDALKLKTMLLLKSNIL